MAASDLEDDDDEFFEYNPHPYQGGYDIAATYGSPLPPSPATCYPVSTPALSTPPPAPSPPPGISTQPPPPAPSPPPGISTQLPSLAPAVEPYYWPEPYDYGEAARQGAEPMYGSPEVFRGWPYWMGSEGQVRGGRCCGRDYWRQWMRGLDYLFGHSDGYGERRIGADSSGVPVYANKKGGWEEAVVVEVAPPVVGSVGFHDAGDEPVHSNKLSWYSDRREETYAYSQPTYNSYDRSPYEQPYSLYGDLDEAAWVPKASYQEVHREEESRYQESLSYDEESKIFGQPIYCYNQHFYEQPLNVQVEPVEPVCSKRLEYYENFSSYDDQREVHILESSKHSYEARSYAQVPDAPLEPFKPSWSQNLGFYQVCLEGETPEYHNGDASAPRGGRLTWIAWTTLYAALRMQPTSIAVTLSESKHSPVSGESGDMGSLFVSSYYPQETQIYQQSHGDELDSFEQNWHNLSNRNIRSEAISQISKSADDSYHINGSFWPFEEYSSYNV